MSKYTKINADELQYYVSTHDANYQSKYLCGEDLAGFPLLNINEGTLAPFQRTTGASHKEGCEVYYMLDVGENSFVVLGQGEEEERIPVRNGDIILIPVDTWHWIDNTQCEKPFKLWTLWDRQEMNGMYFKRKKDWGTSIRYLKDEK